VLSIRHILSSPIQEGQSIDHKKGASVPFLFEKRNAETRNIWRKYFDSYCFVDSVCSLIQNYGLRTPKQGYRKGMDIPL
jgi:hypothetical protein